MRPLTPEERKEEHEEILFVVLGMLVIAVLSLLMFMASGQARELHPGQYKDVPPKVQQWFRSQKIPGTTDSCCNEADGTYAEEEIRGAQYWTRFVTSGGVRVDWMPVPPDRVINPNINGSPVVWYYWDTGPSNKVQIRCYAPGGGV